MKKIAVFLLVIGLIAAGCSAEKYRDNQVYVADSGAENQEDRFVDWLDVQGRDNFAPEETPPDLSAGEIWLAESADEKSYYAMRPILPVLATAIVDIDNIAVEIVKVDRASGVSQPVAQRVPFVTKTAWNHAAEIVAFCGGGQLSVYDSTKGQLILQQELEGTIVDDFFWSPVDKSKLYIEEPDTAGGGLYYVDPQKRVELYETKEKVYYKAFLDKNYYYATEWRNSEGEGDGDLYTVLADDGRKIIKIIGQGIYKDSYRNSVLLTGNDRFGLFFVADINQVSKGFLLTEQYVYDAKFIQGGKIAFITRLAEDSGNRFALNICDSAGDLLQSMTVSGSGLLLSPDGRYGYISGCDQEIVDLQKLQLLQRHPVAASDIDTALLETLRGASLLYCHLLLGQAVEAEEVGRYFTDDDRVGMAYAEILARLPQEAAAGNPMFVQAQLDREHSLIAVNGDVATCHLRFNGLLKGGVSISEEAAWDLVKVQGKWLVAGLGTFCQESKREALLQSAEMDLKALLLWPAEGVRWRQVQYWQMDKQAVASRIEDAGWVKIDGEPGGLILWLAKGEDKRWRLEQVWSDGGWVYPLQQEEWGE